MIWTVVLIGLVISGWGAALCIRRDLREEQEARQQYETLYRDAQKELVAMSRIVEAKDAEIHRVASVLVEVREDYGAVLAENKRLQGMAIDDKCNCDEMQEEFVRVLAGLRAVRDLASEHLALFTMTAQEQKEAVYNVGP